MGVEKIFFDTMVQRVFRRRRGGIAYRPVWCVVDYLAGASVVVAEYGIN